MTNQPQAHLPEEEHYLTPKVEEVVKALEADPSNEVLQATAHGLVANIRKQYVELLRGKSSTKKVESTVAGDTAPEVVSPKSALPFPIVMNFGGRRIALNKVDTTKIDTLMGREEGTLDQELSKERAQLRYLARLLYGIAPEKSEREQSTANTILRREDLRRHVIDQVYDAHEEKQDLISIIDKGSDSIKEPFLFENKTLPRNVERTVEALEEKKTDLASMKVADAFASEDKEKEASEQGETAKNKSNVLMQKYMSEKLRSETLKNMSYSLRTAKIVELPSQAGIVNAVFDNFKHRMNVIFAGHLGSGKTSLARHIARLHMIKCLSEEEVAAHIAKTPELVELQEQIMTLSTPSAEPLSPGRERRIKKLYEKFVHTLQEGLYRKQEPEFFSASGESSIYDWIGKMKMTVEQQGINLEEAKKRFKEAGLEDVPEELITELLQKKVLDEKLYTTMVFAYGPLGRALRDQKPIVIDEINMMSASVLARLNDFALLKPGEPFRIQENGEDQFVMTKGFAILGTKNVGKQYTGTNEENMNAATRSRFQDYTLLYPTIEENYDLILSALIDEKDAVLPRYFPKEDFEKLARLAVATTEIQDLFTGKHKTKLFMAGGTGEHHVLEEVVLSTRDLLDKIIKVWKGETFRQSLDEVIIKNFLAAQGSIPEEQKLLLELFIRFGFFKDWKEEDFAKYGMQVLQGELDVLMGAMTGNAYETEEQYYLKLLENAQNRAIEHASSLLRDVR